MPDRSRRGFARGEKVLHRYNRDLGPGEILEVDARMLRVHFPRADETLVFSAEDPPFERLVLPAGVDPADWRSEFSDDLAERLLRGEVDSWPALRNRLAGGALREIREADGLGSYLGGRIELFPHQLHAAEKACRRDPVRWLLADEVGLGKTIEACLILSHLLRTGRAQRILVLAPSTLTVQWLGELYRKFHQVFVLLDPERRRDVERELGPGFNPFETYERAVTSVEDLVAEPSLARLAAASRPDLVVVDEAHRLARRPGHPGSGAFRAVERIVAQSRHALLLSATPLEADTHGFFSLLQLLDPAQFGSWDEFQARLARGEPLPPMTSATRRVDMGGLPPRVPQPVDLGDWPEWAAREASARSLPTEPPPARRKRVEALERAVNDPLRGGVSSGSVSSGESESESGGDRRLAWISQQAPRWKRRGEKTLIFVRARDALIWLKQELEFRLHQRIAVFHEDLSAAQRDLEVAGFARDDGPSILISTECGGEGRNFQFCRRLVLFDLPWNPILVEQRIGRLDRISRRRPVEIVYFRPADGFGAQVTALYERIGLFRRPLGGVETWLAAVAEGIARAAGEPAPSLDAEALASETERALDQTQRSVYAFLHADPYRAELAAEILSRVPPDLETRTEAVVTEAARQYGFDVIDRAERRTWYLEFGALAVIDPLPGLPAGSRWFGTFDRVTAVADETLDFFASGHPLVEAVLQELADGRRGQIGLLEVRGAGAEAEAGAEAGAAAGPHGLVIALEEGIATRLHPFDLQGRPRPEWRRFFEESPSRLAPLAPGEWQAPDGWSELVRGVLRAARDRGRPTAAMGLRFVR